MASNRVGLVIGAVFGLIYVVVNAAALGALVGPVLQVLGVAAFVGLLVVLYRSHQEPADTPGGAVRFGRGYWSVVAAEVVAFVAGIAVLNGPLGLPLAVLPWVTFVVGVHFLGLARVWKAPSLSWLGAGMALCGAAGLAAAALGAPTAAARGPDPIHHQVSSRSFPETSPVPQAGADSPSGGASRFAREDAG